MGVGASFKSDSESDESYASAAHELFLQQIHCHRGQDKMRFTAEVPRSITSGFAWLACLSRCPVLYVAEICQELELVARVMRSCCKIEFMPPLDIDRLSTAHVRTQEKMQVVKMMSSDILQNMPV